MVQKVRHFLLVTPLKAVFIVLENTFPGKTSQKLKALIKGFLGKSNQKTGSNCLYEDDIVFPFIRHI